MVFWWPETVAVVLLLWVALSLARGLRVIRRLPIRNSDPNEATKRRLLASLRRGVRSPDERRQESQRQP